MTTRPASAARRGSTSSRKPGLLSRSGEQRRTSMSPLLICSWIWSHSVTFAELMVAARTPARPAAAIWSRMSASSGEMMMVGPEPRARSREVATKYTADFPHPVRCTTRARRCSATRAWIAVHWSSRRTASSRPTRRRSAASASGRRSSSAPGRTRTAAGRAGAARAATRSPRAPDVRRPSTGSRRPAEAAAISSPQASSTGSSKNGTSL